MEIPLVYDCSSNKTGSVVQGSTEQVIAFLDDDDEWRADKLEKQIKALKNHDAVLCMEISKGYPMRVHKRRSITLDDLRKSTFNPSGLVAKAHVFKDLLFDESLRQGEDWNVFIRIAQRYSLGWVAEPLLLYNEESPDRRVGLARLW